MHNNTPLISIGIPFFNSEKYLSYAINSVIKQTYKNWELFLLDDGSTDNSLKIAKGFENLDSRVKTLSDGKNKGLPARLNELSALANGKFYCRMDADDIMSPNRLEFQVNYLLKNPKIDLVGSQLIAIDNNNKIIGIRKGSGKNHYILKDIIKGTWCVHPTIMGKTVWFKKNKYDTSLKRAQDYDLWLRTIEKSHFSKMEEPCLYYREASTSTIKKYFITMTHLIKIFWKNAKIIGINTSFKMTLLSLIKLIVYVIYWLLGITTKLIQKRSKPLNPEMLKFHQNIINELVLERS